MNNLLYHLITNRLSFYLIFLCSFIVFCEIKYEEEKKNILLITACIIIILLNIFKVIVLPICDVFGLRTLLIQKRILSELTNVNEVLSNALANTDDPENRKFLIEFYNQYCELKDTLEEIKREVEGIMEMNQSNSIDENHNAKNERKIKSE